MSQTGSDQTGTEQKQNEAEMPKHFPPGEEVPDELREDDKVVIVESEPYEEADDGVGLVPTLTAHRLDASPCAWIRVFGAGRDELPESFKHEINESIMNSAYHADESILQLSWFTDEEIHLEPCSPNEITESDIRSAFAVLEALREDCHEEGAVGEARQANEAHALIQEYQDRLVGLQKGGETDA